ncbi:permease [Neobacillus drentensis]|uniref:permease n=1 Tax=Neobacillus drentensis TaxID=220684 RepID=UPI00300323FC
MSFINKMVRDSLVLLLFCLFLLLFLFAEELANLSFFTRLPSTFFNVNTIFLSIILEAIPFIFMGVFVSAIIQSFVFENVIRMIVPRNAYLGLIPNSSQILHTGCCFVSSLKIFFMMTLH